MAAVTGLINVFAHKVRFFAQMALWTAPFVCAGFGQHAATAFLVAVYVTITSLRDWPLVPDNKLDSAMRTPTRLPAKDGEHATHWRRSMVMALVVEMALIVAVGLV